MSHTDQRGQTDFYIVVFTHTQTHSLTQLSHLPRAYLRAGALFHDAVGIVEIGRFSIDAVMMRGEVLMNEMFRFVNDQPKRPAECTERKNALREEFAARPER